MLVPKTQDVNLRIVGQPVEGQTLPTESIHTVDFEGFVASDIRGLRDQLCTALGPKVNCVQQVDF